MNTSTKKYRYAVTAGILVWLSILAATQEWVPIISDANFIFHEAGHAIFSFFGDFIQVLAGSAFQIVLPLSIALAFFFRRDVLGATVMLWWGGDNMIGVGRYIADARAQELELFGGGEHDWANILGRFPHFLPYDTVIGSVIRNLGILLMFASVVILIFYFVRSTNQSLEKTTATN